MNEEIKEVKEEQVEEKTYKYAVGIAFKKAFQTYYFGSDDDSFKVNDKVVVETIRGLEMGSVKVLPTLVENIKITTSLKPIIRKANEEDLKKELANEENVIKAEKIFSDSVTELKLDMHLIFGEYTLDQAKIIFTYIADDRVDFRELLKVLASKLHCRIELRQIGARDRAKVVGGLGTCGLPICCSTFLSDFEGISINMAKNQLLALNIAKLSGQCGKLSCCLKYEDSLYSELKVGLPKIGQRIKYKDNDFKVSSMNVLSQTIRIESKEEAFTLTFEEFLKECKDNHE